MLPLRRILPRILVPVLVIAAAFLAWWTWRTARSIESLGERSLVDSTVLLAREKVYVVERQIIATDLAVEHYVDPDDLDALESDWLPAATKISPTVKSVLVLDGDGNLVRHVSRVPPEEAAEFRARFFRTVAPTLKLDEPEATEHRHVHERVEGRSLFLSILTRSSGGRRYHVVLQGDLQAILSEYIARPFNDPETFGRFSITDESGQRVFGSVLPASAEFTVSRPFPTTLYRWRMSVTAPSARELEARTQRRRVVDVTLVALALSVLLSGLVFLAYAARTEARLNALKSDFIATVSHELKTPLAVIRMYGEMLQSNRVPAEEKKRKYLDTIVRESERLTALIENVLDFARLERGKSAYEIRNGNLGDCVTRAAEDFRNRIEQEKPELRLDVHPVPDSDLDERAVQLLVTNLVDNAFKYGAGGQHVIVRVRDTRAALLLEVEDDGPGIDPTDEKRIFERFYRGRQAGVSGARGSGIGLALVKNIADAHGATISVDKAVPRGAVFRVSFPRRAEG